MRFFYIILVFILTSTGVSRCERENDVENIVHITGRVQIYGNDPHTFVGIIDEDGNEYAVHLPSGEDELRSLQGYLIEFAVIFLDEPQNLGGLMLSGGTVTPVEWEIVR